MLTTVSALHEGIRQLSLLNGGSELEIVRVKDGFGEPKPSGWRCVYFSLRHVPSGLVGELQVTFTKVKAINGRSHRIYGFRAFFVGGRISASCGLLTAAQRLLMIKSSLSVAERS